jgi:hypothetical protein
VRNEALVGRRRLRDGLPRLFGDNRCTKARRLRHVYADLAERYNLATGVSRRVAALCASAWLEVEDLSSALERPHKAIVARRLKRQLRAARGAWQAGLRDLAGMCETRDVGSMSLEQYIAACVSQDSRAEAAGSNGTAEAGTEPRARDE